MCGKFLALFWALDYQKYFHNSFQTSRDHTDAQRRLLMIDRAPTRRKRRDENFGMHASVAYYAGGVALAR